MAGYPTSRTWLKQRGKAKEFIRAHRVSWILDSLEPCPLNDRDCILDLFQRWGHLSVASGSALGLFFILAALVVFPRTILIVAAGASFGIGAAPIILVADTAGGTLAFLLSRYIAADWFRRKLKQHQRLGDDRRSCRQGRLAHHRSHATRCASAKRVAELSLRAHQNQFGYFHPGHPGVQQPASLPIRIPRSNRPGVTTRR